MNAAGQEMRDWLQIENLAAERTFFRPKGDKHDTWWHPRSKSGYSLDHVIVRRGQIGRAKQACTYGAVAVDSDHVPTYLELRVGRMQRRQKAVGQTKPANIAALRDPEKRRAFADAVGLAITDWHSAHPTASLEERAEVFRVIPSAKVLEEVRALGSSAAFGLRQSEAHAAFFRAEPLMPSEEALFDEMAAASVAEQAVMEAADTVGFDDFVAAYNTSTLCGNA